MINCKIKKIQRTIKHLKNNIHNFLYSCLFLHAEVEGSLYAECINGIRFFIWHYAIFHERERKRQILLIKYFKSNMKSRITS